MAYTLPPYLCFFARHGGKTPTGKRNRQKKGDFMRTTLLAGIVPAVSALLLWYAGHAGILPPFQECLIQILYVAAASFAVSILTARILRLMGRTSSNRFLLHVFPGCFLLGILVFLCYHHAITTWPEETTTIRLTLVRILSRLLSLLSKVF